MYLRIFVLINIVFFLFIFKLSAQNSSIKGRVYDKNNNNPLPFVNVIINNSIFGATTDTNGYYKITSVPPGTYTVTCSSVGFKTLTLFEVIVTSTKPAIIDFPLEENATELNEVVIAASPFNKTEESPVSLKTISSAEIYRNPGGNRDISKVIQSLPGVSSSVSFRNDIIVRGGAPNENRFFLDGIEVPNINHFATQGSSGGPVGMINVNFIREVDFYSGAFPANRGNALSSVMDFKQISGNDERLTGTAMIGSSDIGLTLEGPAGKNSNFILSARRSYLQFLFKALKLPFLPTYNDFQLKHTIKFKNKSTLTIIGLAAIDDFELNISANEGVTDSSTIERNNYILGYIPVNSQWNYTVGANYKLFTSTGYTSFTLSRSHLNNKSYKYADNVEDSANLISDYNSTESENKFRAEKVQYLGTLKLNYGLEYENSKYTNSTYNKKETNGSVSLIDFSSELRINLFGLYIQAGKKFFDERLTLSAGIRTDFNDYSSSMNNPFQQISPRFSFSYQVGKKTFLNFNTGMFYQMPAYTVLGFRDNSGVLVNKNNGIKYIQANHLTGGIEINPGMFSKITMEGFYKRYSNYPFLIRDSISLANLGGDFGVIGNEEAVPASKGRSYGFEICLQQKLSTTYYGIVSYTFFKSEFTDKHGNYQPSSWDNRHILNITAGKKLKKNWEIGAKFRLQGGAPYTPYNESLSAKKEIWDVTNQGVPDYDKLNTKRNPVTNSLDIRIDKKWFYKKYSLNAYIDIQNVYNAQFEGPSFLDVERDANGSPVTNPNDTTSYLLKQIDNTSGNILPSVGIMFEF